MRKFILALFFLVISLPSSYAGECFKEYGNLGDKWPGYPTPLTALQELAKTDCPQIGIAYEKTYFHSLIVVDFTDKRMYWLNKTKLGSLTFWSRWSGFTKDQFLEEDGSDGIGFGNFSDHTGDFLTLNEDIKEFLALNGYPLLLRNK